MENIATFKGTLNYGTSFVFSNVNRYYYDDNYANYYLVGNPFTFDINWNKMTFDNIYDGIATLNEIDGTYDYDVDADIKVGDGFFVMATADEPFLSYDNVRKGKSVHESINVVATNSKGSDNVVIHFAGSDKGGFVKLKNLNDDVAEIYVKDDNVPYGILSYDENVTEIPLYFSPKHIGTYSISVESDGVFEYIGLLDKFTEKETNILKETYTFTSLGSDFHDRFVLKIDKKQQSTDDSYFAYISGEELVIDAEGTIQIIDIMGRVVYSSDVVNDNNRINISDFKNATYLIRCINEKGVNVQKIVIY